MRTVRKHESGSSRFKVGKSPYITCHSHKWFMLIIVVVETLEVVVVVVVVVARVVVIDAHIV